ncbi:hypothetical protein M011DRAFT_461277 [Sporormia fimetaria CBS 119925]|uniref:AB hydrolase-1 domain-containing protein n=1 Tax=Sporormia fimetaria CBS 119925 TaxID=1340428 RepID=A0A6A6V2F9_9PLEO|nr:hypothetical protein M011DRAFT_461277 [Sporormia fimetaria CBS 119925]
MATIALRPSLRSPPSAAPTVSWETYRPAKCFRYASSKVKPVTKPIAKSLATGKAAKAPPSPLTFTASKPPSPTPAKTASGLPQPSKPLQPPKPSSSSLVPRSSMGSRLISRVVQEFAENNGIKLITVDRPGRGHSTFKYHKNVLGFVHDLDELLTGLNIDKFYLEGTSGGAPFALAGAYHFPKDRLLATGVMCGSAPPVRWNSFIPFFPAHKSSAA